VITQSVNRLTAAVVCRSETTAGTRACATYPQAYRASLM